MRLRGIPITGLWTVGLAGDEDLEAIFVDHPDACRIGTQDGEEEERQEGAGGRVDGQGALGVQQLHATVGRVTAAGCKHAEERERAKRKECACIEVRGLRNMGPPGVMC